MHSKEKIKDERFQDITTNDIKQDGAYKNLALLNFSWACAEELDVLLLVFIFESCDSFAIRLNATLITVSAIDFLPVISY